MKYCKVCGDDRTAEYRPAQLQTLCNRCAENTPRKASRAGFDAAYWTGGDLATIPESTKREFYSDYLTSAHTLKKYINATTTTGWE